MDIREKRIAKVLERLKKICDEDDEIKEEFLSTLEVSLDGFLNDLANNDYFGTEAQSDPRGDFRYGDWSIDRVQGIDD